MRIDDTHAKQYGNQFPDVRFDEAKVHYSEQVTKKVGNKLFVADLTEGPDSLISFCVFNPEDTRGALSKMVDGVRMTGGWSSREGIVNLLDNFLPEKVTDVLVGMVHYHMPVRRVAELLVENGLSDEWAVFQVDGYLPGETYWHVLPIDDPKRGSYPVIRGGASAKPYI
jgi:hypothetical protein